MAAIVQPHRLPTTRPARPDLRLLPGGRHAGSVRATRSLGPWLVLLAVVLAMAGALAVGRGALAGLAPAPPAAHAAPAPAGSATLVVRPGDTMWSIARRIQPTGDVRALVDRLIAANGSASIQAGDRVVVPQ
jgi:LysM repeat protein